MTLISPVTVIRHCVDGVTDLCGAMISGSETRYARIAPIG